MKGFRVARVKVRCWGLGWVDGCICGLVRVTWLRVGIRCRFSRVEVGVRIKVRVRGSQGLGLWLG